MYVLSRADGRNLRVNDTVWEAALALAFAYGWVPAGTTSPTVPPSADPAFACDLPRWNRQDYFSHRSQQVLGDDALAFASALLRGLLFRCQETRSGNAAVRGPQARLMPTARLAARRHNLLRGVALFAGGGAFTID